MKNPIKHATRLSLWTLAIAMLLAGCPLSRAQGTVPSAPVLVSPMPQPTAIPSALTPDLAVPAAPDNYPIGDRDLLAVFVYQMPSMTHQVRVNSQGTILLPMLSRPIQAAGRTAPELAAVIAHDLVTARLAAHPVVNIVVRQVNSHPIVVSGEVRYPGVIQATQPMSLLEVLSRAGGLSGSAGTQILLTRSAASGLQTRTLRIDDIIQHAADPRSNPILDGGESVRVLPARFVYVLGSLQKPGAFPLHSDEPITVLKAIALAQGIKSPAKNSDALVFRGRDGASAPIHVNISKILDFQAPDLSLQAGDILFVPESHWGNFFKSGTAAIVQTFSIAVGYSLVH